MKPEPTPEPAPRAATPRTAEAPTRRAERSEAARPGEPVTAYDHLWFERRPLV